AQIRNLLPYTTLFRSRTAKTAGKEGWRAEASSGAIPLPPPGQYGADPLCATASLPATAGAERRTGERRAGRAAPARVPDRWTRRDRKSTRLNSSHEWI